MRLGAAEAPRPRAARTKASLRRWRLSTALVSGPADRACNVSGAVCTADGEQLSSRIEATVPGPLPVAPVVSIAAGASPVTEDTAAEFALTRTGDTAAALTVSVSVSEVGAVLSGTPVTTVTLGAGSAEATLSVGTDDDSVAEADGRVTASISAGPGYAVDADAGSAEVDVHDNEEATSTTTVETLWTSTLTPENIGGALLGYMGFGNALSPDGWSEDGEHFVVEQLYYFAQHSELAFGIAAAPPEAGQLTLHLDDVELALSGVSSQRYFYWTVTDPGWQAVAVKLTRVDPDGATDAGPGVSVADAQVQEADGAMLAFSVTLDAVQSSTASVRYATSDGTATAEVDYTAASGVLRFAPGVTAKTVSVGVLNDAHDEGSETLTLTLSRAFGADLSDDEATGTIVNTGTMPQAWLTRFGRTVGLQAVEAIGERLRGTPGVGDPRLVVGGLDVTGTGSGIDPGHPGRANPGSGLGTENWLGPETRGWGLSGRDLLLGSRFALGAGGGGDGPAWTAWGRFASSAFVAGEGDVSLDGDVVTGFLGADVSRGGWLAGLALGLSEAEGAFDELSGDRDGEIESSLTSFYPYARLRVTDRVDVWRLLGYGSGGLTLTRDAERFESDIRMRMGALGARGDLVAEEDFNGFGLALKSDAFWVRTESDAARSSTGGNLEAASGDVTRLRLILEGSRACRLGGRWHAGPGTAFGIEGSRTESSGNEASSHALTVHAAVRW